MRRAVPKSQAAHFAIVTSLLCPSSWMRAIAARCDSNASIFATARGGFRMP